MSLQDIIFINSLFQLKIRGTLTLTHMMRSSRVVDCVVTTSICKIRTYANYSGVLKLLIFLKINIQLIFQKIIIVYEK